MAANTAPYPNAVRRDAWIAYGSTGNRAAFAQVYVDAIGANPFLKIIRRTSAGETERMRVRLPAAKLPMDDGDIVVPTNYAQAVTVLGTEFTASSGVSFWLRVGTEADSVYLEAPISKVGPVFTISADLVGESPVSAASIIGIGACKFGAPRSSPVVPKDPTTVKRFRYAVVGDSIWDGSDPANEPTYVGPRGFVARAMAASPHQVTAIGINNRDKSVRGGGPSWSVKSAAQGGARLTVGDNTIYGLLGRLKDDNPGTDFSDLILVMEGGPNDAFNSATGQQIREWWQTVIERARALFPGCVILCVGVFPCISIDSSKRDATIAYLNGLHGQNKLFHCNLEAKRNAAGMPFDFRDFLPYPASSPPDGTHMNYEGAERTSPFLIEDMLNLCVPLMPTATGNGSSGVTLAQLIAQQTAHEVFPFVANRDIRWANEPFKIAEQTVGIESFSLIGSALMPRAWFNPGNYNALATQYFGCLIPWWVVCNRRFSQSDNRNANSNPNAAVRVSGMQLLVWRGGNNWDAPINGSTSWVGSYLNDFQTFQAGASWKYDGADVIARASASGLQVAHGGGSIIASVSNPGTVKGVVYRFLCQAVDYNTLQPIEGDVTAYAGVDAVPVGGSANTSFQGYNYAPGLGSSSFLRVGPTPRYCAFTSLSAAQIQQYGVPGY